MTPEELKRKLAKSFELAGKRSLTRHERRTARKILGRSSGREWRYLLSTKDIHPHHVRGLLLARRLGL